MEYRDAIRFIGSKMQIKLETGEELVVTGVSNDGEVYSVQCNDRYGNPHLISSIDCIVIEGELFERVRKADAVREKLFEYTNRYLHSIEVSGISSVVFTKVMNLLYKHRKVDAIKELRSSCIEEVRADIVLGPRSHCNKFAGFVSENGTAVFIRVSRLGLKDAKDIVDILAENL